MNIHKFIWLLIATVIAMGTVRAEDASPLSANIGVVSNYMWRGLSQTTDNQAIQGGIDYAHSSGFSLGAWTSTLNGGGANPRYELDLYGGYGAKIGDFGYNLTSTYYTYPDVGHWNFWELGASGNWKFLTAGLAYTVNGRAPRGNPYREGDMYYYGGVSFDLPLDFKLAGTLGHTDFASANGMDYTNWQVAVSRDVDVIGTFNLTYDQNDGGASDSLDKDPKVWVGWKKTF